MSTLSQTYCLENTSGSHSLLSSLLQTITSMSEKICNRVLNKVLSILGLKSSAANASVFNRAREFSVGTFCLT